MLQLMRLPVASVTGVRGTGGALLIQVLGKKNMIVARNKWEVKHRMWGDTVCRVAGRASPPNQLLISSFGTGTARSPKTAHQTAGLLYFIMAGANEREASLCSFQ